MNPTPIVEVAFGYGPFDTVPPLGWTDISAYVEVFSTRRGRSNELDQFSAGTLSLTLVDDDRTFDPLNTAGPYFGQLLPNVPIRVRADVFASEYPIWRGFVDGFDGTPGTFSGTSTITATDAFGILASTRLPESVYERQILSDSPTGFWRLGEVTGNQLTDASGNSHDGEYATNAVKGEASVVPYSVNGSAKSSVANTIVGLVPNAPLFLPNMKYFTVEFWFQSDGDGKNALNRILQADTIGVPRGFIVYGLAGTISPDGNMLALATYDSNVATLWKANIWDQLPHHIVVRYEGSHTPLATRLYVDGQQIFMDHLQDVAYIYPANGVVGQLIIGPRQFNEEIMDGRIDEIAVYDYLLSYDQILAHYNAGTAPWDGDTTGGRAERVLDAVGWPSALQAIDTGGFFTGPASLAGEMALDYLQLIGQSEQGRLFVDASGLITFHERGRSLTYTAETTVQVTFSDGVGGILVDPSLKLTLDKTFIYNEAFAARGSGSTAQTASDPSSVAAYGPRARSLSNLVLGGDVDARRLAEYIVFRYKDPQVRASEWIVDPTTAEEWVRILPLEIGNRIKIQVTPQGVGSAIEIELHLESVVVGVNAKDDAWTVTFTGSPVDDSTYLTWGTGLWGTDVWR